MKNKIIKINKKYNYDILKNDMLFLNYEYPFFKINNIGESTLGEKIIYIKLGKGNKKIFIKLLQKKCYTKCVTLFLNK